MKKSSNKGFTLVELIIVIAILAIIMLIAIPNFSGIQQRMQVRADKATAAQIGKAFRIWYTEYQSDPAFKASVDKCTETATTNANDGKIGKLPTMPTMPENVTSLRVDTYVSSLPVGDDAVTAQIHTIPYLITYVDTTLLPTSLRQADNTAEPNQFYWIGLTGTGTGEKVVVSIGKEAISLDANEDEGSVTSLTETDITYDGTADAVAYLEP